VDLLDMGGMSLADAGAGGKFTPKAPMNRVCGPEKSGGIEIFSGFVQRGRKVYMDMELHNYSAGGNVETLAIQLNKNAFGLSPINQQINCNPPVSQGSKGLVSVELASNPNMVAPVQPGQPASPQVQVAIKNMQSGNVFYFAVNCNLEALFAVDGKMERSAFIESWKSIDDRNELYGTVSDLPHDACDIESVQQKFEAHNIFFIARRPVPNAEGQEVVYFSMKTLNGMAFLAELTFKRGVSACKVCLKTENSAYGIMAKNAIEGLLRE
jgi:AP-1 complex subunit beta-1